MAASLMARKLGLEGGSEGGGEDESLAALFLGVGAWGRSVGR